MYALIMTLKIINYFVHKLKKKLSLRLILEYGQHSFCAINQTFCVLPNFY